MIDPKMLELSVYDGIPASAVARGDRPEKGGRRPEMGSRPERWKSATARCRAWACATSRATTAASPTRFAKGEMFKRTYQTGFDDETGDPVFETEEFLPEKMPFHRRDRRRDGRPDDGRRQGDRGLHPAPSRRWARAALGHSPDHGHPAGPLSVDVITGTIKAKISRRRISFHVTSKIDSRTNPWRTGRLSSCWGWADMLYMAGRRQDHPRPRAPSSAMRRSRKSSPTSRASAPPPTTRAACSDGPDEDREKRYRTRCWA